MKHIAFVEGYDIDAVAAALIKAPDIILIEVQDDGDKLVLAPEEMSPDSDYISVHEVVKFVNNTVDVWMIAGSKCDIVRLGKFARSHRNSCLLSYGDLDFLTSVYFEFPDAKLGLCDNLNKPVCEASIDFFVTNIIFDRVNMSNDRILMIKQKHPDVEIFLYKYGKQEAVMKGVSGIVLK